MTDQIHGVVKNAEDKDHVLLVQNAIDEDGPRRPHHAGFLFGPVAAQADVVEAPARAETLFLPAPGSARVRRDVAKGDIEKSFVPETTGGPEVLGASVEQISDVLPRRNRQPQMRHHAPVR